MGGNDVIQMPCYYKRWEAGLPDLRRELRVLDKMGEFSLQEKKTLKERMKDRNLDPDQPIAIPVMGRARPLLAVVDPASARITALIRPN
jgi:hypothetical protein